MRDPIQKEIVIRLSIPVNVILFPRSEDYYVFFKKEGCQQVGQLIDVNHDGNFKFFTDFCQGDLPENYANLLNQEEIIRKVVQNGEKEVNLELQIEEKVYTTYFFPYPLRDGKKPDIVLIGELKGPYFLFKDEQCKKWFVNYYNCWGEVIIPQNPDNYWK